MFEFTNLKVLHENMKKVSETRTIFPFEYKGKGFNCMFLGDRLCPQLFLTSTESNPMVIELEVGNSCSVLNFLDPYDYEALTGYLGLKIKPSRFFWYLNWKISTKFTKKPNYRDVLTVVIVAKANRTKKAEKQCIEEEYTEGEYIEKEEIEEENKLYFCGWYKNLAGERVKNANLEKTMYAFGEEKCDLCKDNNISSCWTDVALDEDIQKLDSIYSMIE